MKEIILLICLFIGLFNVFSEIKIKELNKKIHIEIIEPYEKKIVSNTYFFKQVTEIREVFYYEGFLIENIITFMYICHDQDNNYVMIVWSDDKQFLIMNDIEFIIEKKHIIIIDNYGFKIKLKR